MIYRYVSSETVITRLRRKFSTNDWIKFSIIHLADAIQNLGFATKRTSTVGKGITIANHKGMLPCDLEFITKVEKVEDNGGRCRLPLNKDVSMLALSCDDYIWRKENGGYWYDILPPYIRTSFESGKIDILYDSFYTDENGFIMIPDIPSYRWYLEWYLMSQLILEGYTPKANITFDYASREAANFEKKAQGDMNDMSEDEHIRFAKIWTSFQIETVTRNYIDVE